MEKVVPCQQESHHLTMYSIYMVFTGYHLLSLIYGDVTYVPRSEYASREAMLQQHAARIEAEAPPGSKVICLAVSVIVKQYGSVN